MGRHTVELSLLQKPHSLKVMYRKWKRISTKLDLHTMPTTMLPLKFLTCCCWQSNIIGVPNAAAITLCGQRSGVPVQCAEFLLVNLHGSFNATFYTTRILQC